MITRRSIGIVLMIVSIVAALIVFVGFGVPPAIGRSVFRLDANGTGTQTSSIQFHWSAIVLGLVFIIGLIMALLASRSRVSNR